MDEKQFKEFLKNIPPIEITLEWYDNRGEGSFEKEFESNSLSVWTYFHCYETGIIELGGGVLNAPEFISDGIDVQELEYEVCNSKGDEVCFTTEQSELLIKEIETSIISI
jgi:hypothetical protein